MKILFVATNLLGLSHTCKSPLDVADNNMHAKFCMALEPCKTRDSCNQ